ncbi:MFS transporter [Frondihabitans australicus]|uniref:MFS transporter n=1 Tax=Frondihabitans australicus TaxID=386892 RepID=A0A495INF7_9MICO|nr:MFS transporter [Frondihabitans australicus]RKR76655.1 MFS transporter [Frondihabitans australicus]
MSTAAVAPPRGVFSREHLFVTLGMCALIGIAAFEQLAVTTVMPTVARQLHGEALYSLAFAAPLATSVVGMVVAGNWADRSGPRVVVISSMITFGCGLLIVAGSPTMEVLLIGRLVQGFGSGAMIVGLYVMVARLYPPELHPSVFAGFAAAWVIPGLVGPVIAGSVTQAFGWHWVFLGALAACVPAVAMIAPSLGRVAGPATAAGEERVPWSAGRILWSLAAAAAVVALNLLSEVPAWATVPVIVLAVALLAVALRPLLPRRALLAGAGVPTLVLLRGLVSAAFTGGDVYIPYLLSSLYGFGPAASGVTLTAGAVSWAFASWVQGRLGPRPGQLRGIRIGVSLVVIGIAAALATPLWHLTPGVIIVAWAVAGFGMGFMYPRFSVLTLRWSGDDEKGFNSSALTISESSGGAVVLAVTGAAFGVLGGAGSPAAFVACFGVAGVFALVALGVSGRAVPRALRATA